MHDKMDNNNVYFESLNPREFCQQMGELPHGPIANYCIHYCTMPINYNTWLHCLGSKARNTCIRQRQWQRWHVSSQMNRHMDQLWMITELMTSCIDQIINIIHWHKLLLIHHRQCCCCCLIHGFPSYDLDLNLSKDYLCSTSHIPYLYYLSSLNTEHCTLVTSLAKEVMFSVVLVCLPVCQQYYSKNYRRITMKFYWEVGGEQGGGGSNTVQWRTD